jgi:hypothetical protein
MQLAKPFRLSILAVGEWATVLPASVFLAAAALRLLQPRQYQPARMSWTIFEWTTAHVSRLGAAVLFIGIPGLVAIAGCATLLGVWREDLALRDDAVLALTMVRRRLVVALLAAATLLAVVIVLFAAVHAVTD